MDNHVCLQIIYSTKCLPTFKTPIVLFFPMDNHVPRRMFLMTKCLSTFRTLMVLFLSMDNHVCLQMSLMTECLPTFRTLIVLLLCMDSHVPSDVPYDQKPSHIQNTHASFQLCSSFLGELYTYKDNISR